jgi:hypothetical protein
MVLLYSRLATLLILLMPVTAVGASVHCLKLVFDKFCLGGSFEKQLERTPVGMKPIIQGERSGVIIEERNQKTYVMAYKGVIYKVLRSYKPETRATLKAHRQRLQFQYGPFQDRSQYQGGKPSKARQVIAIRRGEGELNHLWQLSDQPWRVELGWTSELGIHVAYFINRLDAEQKGTVPKTRF